MGHFQTLEEARAFFKKDRFATDNGMELMELGEDTCLCRVEIVAGHRNGLGGVMGGVIFTLADFAFAVVTNQCHFPTVGQQVNILYLNSVKGSRLFARAKAIKNGKSTCIVEVEVTDDTGRDVARFTGCGFKL